MRVTSFKTSGIPFLPQSSVLWRTTRGSFSHHIIRPIWTPETPEVSTTWTPQSSPTYVEPFWVGWRVTQRSCHLAWRKVVAVPWGLDDVLNRKSQDLSYRASGTTSTKVPTHMIPTRPTLPSPKNHQCTRPRRDLEEKCIQSKRE